ncbi:molybdate ABC transporter substrate-binding protein [Arenimonas sp.]|uniref:molybdate ABC transporter substrate-binding protein n=1 Tax=Arenimonas sp. TaxID=1872635 RepID=UPI0025C09C8F|nr:molybdate ABC transporter substrate-binding protein [Arenimonas sp.]
MTVLRCFLCLLLLVALPADGRGEPRALTVFAAASLKESLDAAAEDWTRLSGQPVVVSFAASSALARQIEQGAPADVFISADAEWMDYLQRRQQIDPSTRFDLAANRLVLIAPATSSLAAVALTDREAVLRALGDGRLAVAETASVPAGRYARQSLETLGLWEALEPRLAQGENVRAAMAFVARGEAPIGIVYATDAQAEKGVRAIARFPADGHGRIIYPAARVARSDADHARGFLGYLRGDRAAEILRKAGFSPP